MTTGSVSDDRPGAMPDYGGQGEPAPPPPDPDAADKPGPAHLAGSKPAGRQTPVPSAGAYTGPGAGTSGGGAYREAAAAGGAYAAARAAAATAHPQPHSRRGRARTRGRAAVPPRVGEAAADATLAGGSATRRRRLRGPRPAPARELRRRRHVVLAGMGALTVAGAALAVVGLGTVRNSTVGRYADTIAPTDPGYQAYVVPTPTMAAVTRAPDGSLAGVTVLALEAGDKGGAAIVVPPSTLVLPAPAGATPPTLAEIYADRGVNATLAAVGKILDVAVPDNVVIDADHWARLVAPVAPIELTIDHRVDRWKAGKIRLAADDVGPFLSARAGNETDLDRLDRQERFWSAWLGQVRRGGEDAVPGEVGTGLGRFVRGIASRSPDVTGLPVARFGPRLVPDAPQVARVVSDTVPFPEAPAPGARVRVRLLNGTSDRSLTSDAARALVAAGAEVVIVGNAPTFTVDATTIDYSGADRRALAERLAKASGIRKTEAMPAGDEKVPSSDDEIDVTVVLGRDARDLIGR